ncbi:amino acid transporter [Fistulina hepatica ATCC 64428]|uniref:Amino acid transporter n=1 Tax=Fistulina hepatica ATCC 64428 TaxID=1128425 RepID=A0A0D7AFP0_9AGAR|nr:amino acid transporter [Fistulina hepatica ATCC 64428]
MSDIVEKSQPKNVEAVVEDADDSDDVRELARMGYKQELKRELGLLQNFGVSFSIISIITGIPTLFLYGLVSSPAVMVWGWIVVNERCTFLDVIISSANSAHPTSGGPYFWAAMLSKPEKAAFASWITGWFNLLGQVAVTTGISFGCANFISTIATFKTDFVPTAKTTIGIYAAVLVTQGLINTFGVRGLHYLNNVSIAWHSIGTIVLVIIVLAKAPKLQSGHFVFQTFIDGTAADAGSEGWGARASNAYVAIIGILMAQYTLTGFDASAHMTEETHNAAMSGSIGIIMAIGVSAILGWYLLLGLLFSIQDLDNTINSPTGEPVAQIFIDACGVDLAIFLMIVLIGGMFFCGTFSITSNSRMMYAFSRDGGIPGSKWFATVDKRWKSPVRTVWLACTLSFLLGLPSLGSSVAFSAATSIATIGLYTSYAIPIGLRLYNRAAFVRGPFHLGKFSYPIAAIAVTWNAFITIAFILPEENPVNSQTLNYAIVAVGIVIVYSVGFWLISAHKWFIGPVKQIEAEQAGINVMEPAEAEKFPTTATVD